MFPVFFDPARAHRTQFLCFRSLMAWGQTGPEEMPPALAPGRAQQKRGLLGSHGEKSWRARVGRGGAGTKGTRAARSGPPGRDARPLPSPPRVSKPPHVLTRSPRAARAGSGRARGRSARPAPRRQRLLKCPLCLSLLYLLVILTRTSSTMLNRSGKSKPPPLVPEPLSVIISSEFSWMRMLSNWESFYF